MSKRKWILIGVKCRFAYGRTLWSAFRRKSGKIPFLLEYALRHPGGFAGIYQQTGKTISKMALPDYTVDNFYGPGKVQRSKR